MNKNHLLIWFAILLAISIASFFPSYLEGMGGDCTPNQIDGQCGLSTFLGQSYGLAASVAVLMVGRTVLAIVHNRMKKEPTNRT